MTHSHLSGMLIPQPSSSGSHLIESGKLQDPKIREPDFPGAYTIIHVAGRKKRPRSGRLLFFFWGGRPVPVESWNGVSWLGFMFLPLFGLVWFGLVWFGLVSFWDG